LALLIPGVFAAGCVYVDFQQTGRDQANVPAAMLAEQVAYQLRQGESPQDALPASTDPTTTITPFAMIFNADRQLVASSGDPVQTYPSGCFDQVDATGANRVTWQPASGLRFATVAVKYQDGYVVGAYSLSESEGALDRFTTVLVIGLIGYTVGCAVLLAIYGWLANRRGTTRRTSPQP